MCAVNAFQCTAVRDTIEAFMDIEDVKLCGRMYLTTTVLCDRIHLSVLASLQESGAGGGDAHAGGIVPLSAVASWERPRFSLGLVVAAFIRRERRRHLHDAARDDASVEDSVA